MGTLSVKQEQSIAWAVSRMNIWCGAIRSGKTLASLIAWMAYIATAPPGELIMVGRSVYSLGRNIFTQLQDPILFGAIARTVQYTPGAVSAKILGRRIHVIGATDVRSEAKIRGITCAGAYVDEITIIPESFFTQLLGRMSVPGAQLFGTTNPDSSGHWLRRDFLLRAAEMSLKSFHFTLDDNPSLTPEFLASIKAEFTGLWYRRFILGEWCAAEGAIYDQFDYQKHVVTTCPVIVTWLCVSIDYGTSNPTDMLLLGIGADRKIYVVSEYRWDAKERHRQLTDAEQAVKLKQWLASVRFPGSQLYGVRPDRVILDPSAASLRAQLFTDGWSPHLAENDVLNGIRTVSSLLSTGRLLIHDSCVHLIEEMQSYSWDETAQVKGLDQPIKQDDHAVDALRYGVMTTRNIWRGQLRPAEDLLIGA